MTTTLMQFRYGDYWHDPGEVNLVRVEVVPIYTNRNQRTFTRYKLHIQGELIPTDAEITAAGGNAQDAIHTKMQALITAYADNNKFAGLYRSSDTAGQNPTNDDVTVHALDPAHPNNFSGNRIEYRSWPRGAPDEFVTARTFYIVITADYLDADSLLLEFRETIRVRGVGAQTGLGNADWKWVLPVQSTAVLPNPVGATPIYLPVIATQQITKPGTIQVIEQFGSAVGLTFHPVGNVPPPVFPAWERTKRRVSELGDPKWYGQSHAMYPVRWYYEMHAPITAPAVLPTILGYNP